MNTENNTPKEIWIEGEKAVLRAYTADSGFASAYFYKPTKYLSESHHNEVVAELKAEIERLKSDNEAHKNKIRVLQRFIPDSENNPCLDSNEIPICKSCGEKFNNMDLMVIKSLPANVCSSCFTSNA